MEAIPATEEPAVATLVPPGFQSSVMQVVDESTVNDPSKPAPAAEPAPGAPRDAVPVVMAEKPRSHAFNMLNDAEQLLQGLRALPLVEHVRHAMAHVEEAIKRLYHHIETME